jgi:flagellar hook-associated protein 2
MASISSTGLGSGIDVNGIVAKLVAAERTPVSNRLDKQEAELQAKISAFGSIKGALGEFRTAMGALKNASSFVTLQASSNDPTVVTASATSKAELSSYQVMVKQLAQSHGLASKAYSSATDTVGTGTITIKFGTTTYDPDSKLPSGFTQNAEKGTLTLTVDSSNNTLTGLRDAINKANAGVTASIVNDGTGFRLVLNSADSGVKNSMEITASDPGATGLSAFAFNAASAQMTQTVSAQDALVNINGLDVISPTNTVSSALSGVTLNLLKAQPDAVVSLNVTQNNEDIAKAIQGMLDKFNAVVESIKKASSYDVTTKRSGVLAGDFSVRGALNQLRNLIGEPVNGLSGNIRTLVDIGIRTQADGKLALDSAKLDRALATGKDDVIALFAPLGIPSDSGISYLGNTAATKPGTYAVHVTSAATQGFLAGAANPASLVVDASNDTLQLKVNGVASGVITLTQSANYDTTTFAAELQSRINGDATLKAAGASVAVTYDSTAQRFLIQSQSYGSASNIEITQVGAVGSGATVGGLGVGTGTDGQDAQATLDGVATTASGRQLIGASGNAEGLRLLLNDNVTASRGTIRFTRGLAERFDEVLAGILDVDGTVSSRIEGLQNRVTQIDDERIKLEDRMQALQVRLLKQFNAMDALVGQLQAIGTYMTQQLATLPYAPKSQRN